jgi:zinc transport system ATP-binding protein
VKTTTAVTVSGVTWSYRRGTPVLRDIDLELARGSVTSISGPNGCGKSTLMRLLAGVVRPHHGTISRRGPVGYLPQSSDEPPVRMQARSWLGTFARIKGADDDVDALARELGVAGALDGPLESLSVGTLTKVLVIAAFIGRPALIVLDEPFAPLDALSRDALTQVIARAASRGAAVVVTSHDELPTMSGDHLTLVDGHLEVRASGVRRWRIVVRTPDGPVEETLDANGRDAFLRSALDAGWEILRVEER